MMVKAKSTKTASSGEGERNVLSKTMPRLFKRESRCYKLSKTMPRPIQGSQVQGGGLNNSDPYSSAYVRGRSSHGGAVAQHATGRGIDALRLHVYT